MVQFDLRDVCSFEARCVSDFAATECASDFLGDGFVVPEFLEERLVEQVLDVFCVVECCC